MSEPIRLYRANKPRPYGSVEFIVTELLEACGGPKRAAALLGLGSSQIHGYADPDVLDANIKVGQARKLALVCKSPALAKAAAFGVGGYFVPAPSSTDSVAQLIAHGETARGRFMADFLTALDREGATGAEVVLRDLDDCLSTLAAVRAKCGHLLGCDRLSASADLADASLDASRRLKDALEMARSFGSSALARATASDVDGYFVAAPASDESVAELMAHGETLRGRFIVDFLRGFDREGGVNATPKTLGELDACLATLAALRARLAP